MGNDKFSSGRIKSTNQLKNDFAKNFKHPILYRTGSLIVQSNTEFYPRVFNLDKHFANFTRIRKVCQYVFKEDIDVIKLLRLDEPSPDEFDLWHDQVMEFYQLLLTKVDTDSLEIFEITRTYIRKCWDDFKRVCTFVPKQN